MQIAEAVGAATGKNFILDPRVRAQVTMLSSTPLSPDALLSKRSCRSWRCTASSPCRRATTSTRSCRTPRRARMPGDDLPDRVSRTSDEIVTQVIQVKNVNAAQLVPILRSLVNQNGHLAAYPPSNILIISDRAANVNRIQRIIGAHRPGRRLDVEIVPLQNASAADVVRNDHAALPAAAGAGRRRAAR